MKRMVESVGIGDIGTTNISATLQISPLHIDDVGVLVHGSQAGTQTADLLQLRDSTGVMVAKITAAGVLTAGTIQAGTFTTIGSNLISDLGVVNASVLCGSTVSGDRSRIVEMFSTLVTATNVSGVTRLYADTVTANTVVATTFTTLAAGNNKIDVGFVNCAVLSANTVSGSKFEAASVTAFNISASTNVMAATLTATQAYISKVHADTLSALCISGVTSLYANAGKIHTNTLSALCISGVTSLYVNAGKIHTDSLTAVSISGVTSLYANTGKIHTDSLTALSVSGVTSLYVDTGKIHAQSLTAVSISGADAIRSVNICASDKLYTVTLTAAVISGVTSLYANAGKIHTDSLTALSISGVTSLYANAGKIHAQTISASTISGATTVYLAASSTLSVGNDSTDQYYYNQTAGGEAARVTHTVITCATVDATVISAYQFAVPLSSVVTIIVNGAWITKGTARQLSAGGFQLLGTMVGTGADYVGQNTTAKVPENLVTIKPGTISFTPCLCTGSANQNLACLALVGSANTPTNVVLDITKLVTGFTGFALGTA